MTPAIDDSLSARISSDCPQDIRDILHHAWGHDLTGLRTLLDTRSKASAQDPQTGETPLHAAIRACGQAGRDGDDTEQGHVEEAREILQELFLSGAIWNDVDNNNETPGCLALRLGQKALYDLCVDAGFRAELLFALVDGYEELSSGSEAEEDITGNDVAAGDGAEVQPATDPARFVPPDANAPTVTNDKYLQSSLTYDSAKLLDSDLNGVMMSWETDIMRRSVSALLPDAKPGKRILNIGFGMGIIDDMFAATNPSRHHIIEAHPSVLEHISKTESRFGDAWEKTGAEEGAYKVWPGKWQDVVPKLLAQGEVYDAIFFDTFAEDYAQLKLFFTEYVPGLLDQNGRFSFFNGLGADRQLCYDVYTKVVDMHAADAGLDVDWLESTVDMAALSHSGKDEWKGVRQRYWTLHTYRLPLCTFLG